MLLNPSLTTFPAHVAIFVAASRVPFTTDSPVSITLVAAFPTTVPAVATVHFTTAVHDSKTHPHDAAS